MPDSSSLRIRFFCTDCSKPLRAKPGEDGKVFRCPFCRTVQTVPYGVQPTASRVEHEKLLRFQEAEESGGIPKIITQAPKTALERYFQRLGQSITRMATESIRILENDRLDPEQKERLIRSQLEQNREEAARFRDTMKADIGLQREEARTQGIESSPRMQKLLTRMQSDFQQVDLLVRVMYEESLGPEGEEPQAPDESGDTQAGPGGGAPGSREIRSVGGG